ncbi:unnamed protein product [Medioppia subpectinata]|uniref:Phospholipid scramblase n=1 Tax=Medioppia subpectinata TaxID=1979941 RepID=A0A7R9L5H2_9ACAR|nr:unnamed protein product [Medioppia subpectinata]CAG2114669.1 unnamed protein product [Medioppia subpectinata]
MSQSIQMSQPIHNQPQSYGQPPGAYGQPVPVQSEWIAAPMAPPLNCPPGLEYLTTVDQLLVHQKVELWEAFTGFETNNKYAIKNSLGQKVYYAIEDTDCCTRYCCGALRPFDIQILDNSQREVIHLYRPLKCANCCCFCCLQRLEVAAPPGNVLGHIVQEWSLWVPKFRVEDASGETVLRIEGPCCTVSCCADVEFRVLSPDGGQPVGTITKQWTGLAREMFTDADHFGITFPLDLDVNVKALLLGACFPIDFMYFEKTDN